MAERPPPPVPPECTMAGNDWFPWYFDRLRKSKWWRRASDMARARNVMLWGEAYKAVPAGGLVDDDDELAEAAGFGMDVAAFLAVKAEIMAPWTLCDDGRWYHPTVCEVVLERWESTSDRRKAAAAKKRAQRERARNVPPENGGVPHPKAAVPRDMLKKDGDNTPLTRVREQDTTDKTVPDADASSSLNGDGEAIIDPVDRAFAAWNELARRLGLPVAKTLDAGRRKALKARTAGGLGAWTEALAAVERSRHCRGGGERGWRADIDFVADPKNFRRLREGFYGDDAPAEQQGPRRVWPGPPEVRLAVVAVTDEDFAVGYLDRCRWRDVPERAVVAANAFVAETIGKRAGQALTALGVAIRHEVAA